MIEMRMNDDRAFDGEGRNVRIDICDNDGDTIQHPQSKHRDEWTKKW